MCKNRFSIFFISLWFVSALTFTVAISTAQAAATESGKSKVRYVSDNIAITMRSGKSPKHRVIQSLSSGEKLRLLEYGKTYSRLKTGKGKEGWVLTQYLADQPTARQQLPSAIDKIDMLEAQNREFRQELSSIKKERNQLQKVAEKYSKLETEHKTLSEEAVKLRKAASSQMELMEKTESLTEKTQFLQNQLDIALNENKELRDESRKQWFLIGAGVVLVSMLLGLMMGRRKPKQSTWASSTDTLMLRQP